MGFFPKHEDFPVKGRGARDDRLISYGSPHDKYMEKKKISEETFLLFLHRMRTEIKGREGI
jgi:hypothetical protein